MSDRGGVVTRLIARIRALLPQNWRREPGERFRNTTTRISEFTAQHRLRPADVAEEAVILGRRKLEGAASEQYAAAMRDFAEAEQKKIEIEFQRRSLESRLRKEHAEADQAEADARLTRAGALDAELDLLKKLNEIGVVLQRHAQGNLTVLPRPESCDLDDLVQRRLLDERGSGPSNT